MRTAGDIGFSYIDLLLLNSMHSRWEGGGGGCRVERDLQSMPYPNPDYRVFVIRVFGCLNSRICPCPIYGMGWWPLMHGH